MDNSDKLLLTLIFLLIGLVCLGITMAIGNYYSREKLCSDNSGQIVTTSTAGYLCFTNGRLYEMVNVNPMSFFSEYKLEVGQVGVDDGK